MLSVCSMHIHTVHMYYICTHCLYSAIAKARENIISDAISDNSGSYQKTTPTSGVANQPSIPQQHLAAEKKGQRSPAHPPPVQNTVTVAFKDLPMTKVYDVMIV